MIAATSLNAPEANPSCVQTPPGRRRLRFLQQLRGLFVVTGLSLMLTLLLALAALKDFAGQNKFVPNEFDPLQPE